MTSPLAPFLLPDGYARPPLVAIVREATLVGGAGRLAVHRGSLRRARRRTPYPLREAPRRTEPVLLVPGFLAGDWTLAGLSTDLRRRGHRTYRSDIAANVGCTAVAALMVEQRLERIADRRGVRVWIVGHSLGGMIARGVAVRRPDLVAGIVTLGSPMRAPAAHHRLLTGGVEVLTRLNRAGVPGVMSQVCVSGDCAEASFGETQQPLSDDVTMTNVYSRRDGIVDWRACIDPDGEAVEVRASHIGLALDPRVYDVVARAISGWPAADGSAEVDRGETA